jgi:hypothetical protein
MSLSSRQTPQGDGTERSAYDEPKVKPLVYSIAPVRVTLTGRRYSEAFANYAFRFEWRGRELRAIIFRKRDPNQRRVRYLWTFMTSDLSVPVLHAAHELPITAAFIQECHRRLCATIKGAQLDMKALQQ